ncbi:NAD(+) diphosphatase [Kineosporia sp. J2-2]|uniref:NAD(+) diphosphatase n=1 Tax=Kineosporia corallincola TaxID=2835133 RepID=A0ABS5TAD9_9ACTN|nr:NAD(+) diphosphatase [Kineosporia corallincola]MBT0768006.1 NAD(+) diphosphatase [Kineosporia corallincola]
MPLERLALSRSTLDRTAERRSDPQLVATLLADPRTRVALIHEGETAITAAPTLHLWTADALVGLKDDALRFFLGTDDEGRGYLALSVAERPTVPEGVRWAPLREVGALLDDAGAGIFTTAVALIAWHAFHTHCANCGEGTDVVQAGWVRLCPNCGREHYPRTDPAVIMTVVDADDRVLLGRQASWPEHRYSTLAGFVEPGESLEDAVRREVLEESGVLVGEVQYRGSQPWPFPSSLMVGFRGEALSSQVRVDGVELAEARWWSREELQADIKAGRLILPPAVSIARRLIEDWFGAPIPDDTSAW